MMIGTMKNRFFIILMISISLVGCGKGKIAISGQLTDEVVIFPDYKDVTIPPNIAPLNFQAEVAEESCLLITDAGGNELQVHAKNGLFDIPIKAWRQLLSSNKGKDLTLAVCKFQEGKWMAYQPFSIHVAEEEIDSYLAYRLVQPGYYYWNQMGIYQRNLESFEQTAIYENKFTDYNCVNCHSFPARNPEKMLFHQRAKHAGTVLVQGEQIEKLNTKTPETISALVYPYWHPSERFIALTVNDTRQAFFDHSENILEVYDNASDVMIYDIEKHEVFSHPLLSSGDAFETFPTFSPDGKSLYFCSATKVEGLPQTYKDVHYSLCRIDIDVENRTFGTQVDTLYNAVTNGMSVSFPRISPNERFLVMTLHEEGNFSIWHPDADLYLLDLDNGNMKPLSEANSPFATDSYHSWSSNSRWLAFSSRRIDGLYTRLFFTYIDSEGKEHKPFMLPQRDPAKFYESLFFSYNIPEFITGKVNLDSHSVSNLMKQTKGVDVSYSPYLKTP